MYKSLSVVSILALAFSFNAFADSAKVLKVSEKIEINASADTVWAKSGNYGDLGAFHPAVAKTEIASGTNNKKGAVRVLTLQDGGKITERLTAYQGKKMSYSYVITESVLPVSNYSATITVKSLGEGKSEVLWNASFKRKNLSDAPASGQDDEAAVKTITGVFKGGLDNLKKITETK